MTIKTQKKNEMELLLCCRHELTFFLSIFMILVSPTNGDVHGQNISDADKASLLADYILNHEPIVHQLWEIETAGSNLLANITAKSASSADYGSAIERYILMNLPNLLRDETFHDVTKDVVDELSKGVENSGVTKEEFQKNTSQAILKVLKFVNPVAMATRSIESAKPVIDKYRQKDSSIFIAALNTAIKYSAYIMSSQTFQHVYNIVVEEVSKGLEKTNLTYNITHGPKGYTENNTNSIATAVMAQTNIPRMISRCYEATKPVIDKYYGKNSEYMFGTIVTILGLGSQVWKNPTFKGLKYIFFENFLNAYNKSGLESKGDRFLIYHPIDVYQAVLMQMDYKTLLMEMLNAKSIRDVLPRQSTDAVTEICYNDAMDVIDAAKAMQPWALKILDALGKPAEGLAKGRINLLGSYDECSDITMTIEQGTLAGLKKSSPTYPRSVGTKFCRVKFNIPESLTNGMDTKGLPVQITWGICVPNTCRSHDVENIFKLAAIRNKTEIDDYVAYVDCSEHDGISQDGSAIAAICILSIFAFLMLCGTLIQGVGSMKPKGDSKTPGNQEKTDSNVYTNLAFTNESYDQLKSVSIQRDSATDRSLPVGYMPHAENGVVNSVNGSLGKESNGLNGEIQNKMESQKETKQKKPKEGILMRIFKAFAIQTNAKKILSGHTGEGSINCLHGIRFCSITWIILGHTYNYGLVSNTDMWSTENFMDGFDIIKRFTYQGVIGAGFSVDTFYMISGMLLTYIQLKQMKKLKERFTAPKAANYVFNYYFHRFWRLTPMYAFVLMIFATLFPYFGDGPLWQFKSLTMENCKDYWWTNVLYVNNLVHVDKMCMGWSWFLSNDMQFYAISIIILFFLTVNTILGCVVAGLLMAAGIASAAWKEYIYNGNFFTFKSDGGKYWDNVYVAPWCRVSPFCVGLFLGLIFHKRQQKSFSKFTTLIGWALATAVALFIVYSPYSENKEGGETWTKSMRAAYESLARPAWAACVAWVVFACHNGRGGVVNSILSWEGIIPLSRLSYAAYLVHPILMMIHVYSKRSLVYVNDYEIIYLFLGHTTLTFMASFILSLAFEAPFMALEKLIIR